MKLNFSICCLMIINVASAQVEFPCFLQGTWKAENTENYEHWDMLNDNYMKGISYRINQGKLSIFEYLTIKPDIDQLVYIASVLDQNNGRDISFKLTVKDSLFIFENPDHDFPEKIIYQQISPTQLLVKLSGGKQKEYSYRLNKVVGSEKEADSSFSNPVYDPILAQKLGADDYGMKNYVLVMLKTGSNQTTDKQFISNSFRGHLDNIVRLVEVGKLIVAGPLGKNDKTYRGIFILYTNNFEEAKLILETDPAIREKLLDYEMYQWYGSAALPAYLEVSDKIWKLKP